METEIVYVQGEKDYTTSWISVLIVFLIFYVIDAIAMWKIFEKAGKTTWTAFIPIYSTIVLLEIVGKPIWWIILYFIPIVNVVIYVIIQCRLGDCFKQSCLFKLGLVFLPTILLFILGFGSSQYTTPTNVETFYPEQPNLTMNREK